jgi:septin family protein
MSTSSQPTAEETKKTRAKFKQFRILVIGRANAGKTTILRKVCNTTGEPIIFDPDGKKVKCMSKFMSDTDIHARDLRSSRPPLIHP